MSFVIGRGRYAREAYPQASPSSGGGAGPTGATGHTGATGAGSTGPTGANGPGGSPTNVINTGSFGPSNPLQIALGGAGMPVTPATHTAVTGTVKVTVQAAVTGTGGGGQFQYFLIRDGSEVGSFFLEQVDPNVGGVSNAVTLIALDSVTAGTAHSWGMQIHGLNGGGNYAVEVTGANLASVIVEDV